MNTEVQIVPSMIFGSWRLVKTYTLLDGKPHRLDPLGKQATGYVHYLQDGRMAVLIAHEGRKHLNGTRYDAPESELAEAARTFTGYGGTYTCGTNEVVHHLEISSYENDNHTDYVRLASFDPDGRLTLTTPEVDTPAGKHATCLVWERMSSDS